jgi:branched-chain amino acid transport system ATP-binding protein
MSLSLNNIDKSFGNIKVLNNVSIQSHGRECLGIIGPNGAGKSTLFKVISGNLKQDKGDIIFNSLNVNNLNINKRARLGISQSFQKNSLFLEMTVKESIMLALSHKYKITFNPLNSLVSNKEINNDAIGIAKDTGLLDYLDTKSDNLSYGLQRQLELGIAISSTPQLLLLDEPTSGMSPAETKDIIKLIKTLSAKYSIIIVEHDMDVIYELANRIYVLDRGTLIFEGDAKSVKNSELVQNKYLGI